VLTLRCRAPFYPPGNRPPKAKIVAIDETPFRLHMVHHAPSADMFLEGDTVAALRLLADCARAKGIDKAAVEARRIRAAAGHENYASETRAAEEKVAGNGKIHPITLARAIGDALPADTFYVDETITHRGILRRHLNYRGAESYLRPQGGLGQGIGIGLGIKLAARERPVVVIVGDGAFMYNPVIQSLALADAENLPIMVVIPNNNGYLAMKKEHHAFYPDGVSAAQDIFPGYRVTGLEYSEIPKLFGGFGQRVEAAADLPGALKDGLAAIRNGKSAVLNVIVDP